jgi:hypothetical protein
MKAAQKGKELKYKARPPIWNGWLVEILLSYKAFRLTMLAQDTKKPGHLRPDTKNQPP